MMTIYPSHLFPERIWVKETLTLDQCVVCKKCERIYDFMVRFLNVPCGNNIHQILWESDDVTLRFEMQWRRSHCS